MSISDKTRKTLWGRSSSRCAICKHQLIVSATTSDDESVVGDECHIISPHSEGPRYDVSFPQEKLDAAENLILLCRIHHKMVDDQSGTYSPEILRKLREGHEKWVSQKLEGSDDLKPLKIRRLKKNIPTYLTRIDSGKEIINLVLNAYMLSTDQDELKTEAEVGLIGDSFQNVKDLMDLGHDIEPSYIVKANFALSQSLKEIENAGFFVFGAKEMQIMEGGITAEQSNWPVAYLQVVRTDNNTIIKVEINEPNSD